jgi:hypothetical protein
MLSESRKQKYPAGECRLRRQIAAGESLPAGSGRNMRLDPRSLPVRFAADDKSADGHMRMIELDRERVLLSRTVSGIHMRLNLPLHAFLGVAVRLLPARDAGEDAVAIVLEHPDSNLSVPLHVADESDHVIADWQTWGSVLRKKLLVAESDGTLREPFETLGILAISRAVARRARRSALRARRPKIFRRRICTRAFDEMQVHAGEREIIARN